MPGFSILAKMIQGFANGVSKSAQFGTKEAIKGGKSFLLPKYMQKPSPQTMRQQLVFMHEYVQSLPGQHNVSKVWIKHLIDASKKNPNDLKTIIRYLRSPAADSISKWDRADLIHGAVSNLQKILEVIHM